MKIFIKKWGNLKLIMMLFTLLGLAVTACEDPEFSEDYDIPWPLPVINSFSPKEAMIGSEVTVNGTNFEKTSRVYIGDVDTEFELISGTEIKLVVPRVVDIGKIKVHTAYKRDALSEESFVPQFPKTTVSGFPATIERGKSFSITGENVDLITKVQVGDTTMNIKGSDMAPDNITISTVGVDLSADMVTVTVRAAKGELAGTLTANIPVVNADPTPTPMDTILFDFEDGVNPFQAQAGGGLTPVASIDGGPVKGGGDHYFSLTADNVSSWTDLGYIEIPVAVDLSDYSHPHLSFLVNTNGNAGYFQLEDGQGNWYHFLQNPDNYMFETNGWEWRSYDLKQIDDGKDLDLSNFKARLFFKTGNVGSGTFEIHLDQVMVTNGKVEPTFKLWDFENQTSDPFIVDGEPSTHDFNAGGVTPHLGDGYYTVKSGAIGTWKNMGKFDYGQNLDLSSMKDPHLSFWINTNGVEGYFQVEDGNGSWFHFAGNQYGDDYKFVTDGWELRTINLNEAPWEGAGFNPATFNPILFFKTGNVGGDFEINLDEIYISDGPMF